MRVVEVVSPVFAARCCVVVADDGSCVVVDAGAGVAEHVVGLVRTEGLHPHAVLATHGHADHVWDAGRLARELDVPVRLHARDRYRLDDPFGTLGLGPASHDPAGPLGQALAAAGIDVAGYEPPARVETFGEDDDERRTDAVLELGALRVTVRHAPGHTQGSTLYLVEDVAFTGDVLFAGTIGRTDLPGGDGDVMAATLREVVATLDPSTLVVPGHGPTSDMATELATNPFLARR